MDPDERFREVAERLTQEKDEFLIVAARHQQLLDEANQRIEQFQQERVRLENQCNKLQQLLNTIGQPELSAPGPRQPQTVLCQQQRGPMSPRFLERYKKYQSEAQSEDCPEQKCATSMDVASSPESEINLARRLKTIKRNNQDVAGKTSKESGATKKRRPRKKRSKEVSPTTQIFINTPRGRTQVSYRENFTSSSDSE